jgi:hypothetical protein
VSIHTPGKLNIVFPSPTEEDKLITPLAKQGVNIDAGKNLP